MPDLRERVGVLRGLADAHPAGEQLLILKGQNPRAYNHGGRPCWPRPTTNSRTIKNCSLVHNTKSIHRKKEAIDKESVEIQRLTFNKRRREFVPDSDADSARFDF